MTSAEAWQVRFDGGHQYRYLPDRAAVLRYILAVGPRAASPRFEVFAETAPETVPESAPETVPESAPETVPVTAKGAAEAAGRRFELVEVIDLARDGEIGRLRAELGLA